MSTLRYLLCIRLYSYTYQEIQDLWKEYQRVEKDGWDTPWFPEYYVRREGGGKVYSADGNIEEKDGEPFLLFDIEYQQGYLEEFISNTGVCDFFNDFVNIYELFLKLPVITAEDKYYPQSVPLVVEISTSSSYDYYSGCWDVDQDVSIIGWLDNHLKLTEWKQP